MTDAVLGARLLDAQHFGHLFCKVGIALLQVMEGSTVALLTGQRSIQVICRADEREMGEGLRKVAKVFTSRTELL